MPPPPVAKQLIEAARRGVKVEILTQGKSDVFVTSWAAQYAYQKFVNVCVQSLFADLKKEGISIMELDHAELHAKTTEIDNAYAAIGSDNLDHVSWGYNRETKVDDNRLSVTFRSSL